MESTSKETGSKGGHLLDGNGKSTPLSFGFVQEPEILQLSPSYVNFCGKRMHTWLEKPTFPSGIVTSSYLSSYLSSYPLVN